MCSPAFYFACCAHLLNHSTPQLARIVILEPQWLIDVVSAVIRDFDLHEKVSDPAARVHLADWEMLRKFGILSAELLAYIWRDFAPSLHTSLVTLMCRFGLMSPLTFDAPSPRAASSRGAAGTGDGDGGGGGGGAPATPRHRVARYLVPSLLPRKPDVLSHTHLGIDDATATSEQRALFEYQFEVECVKLRNPLHPSHTFMPVGLFERLVAFAISHTQQKRAFAPLSNTEILSMELTREFAALRFGDASFRLVITQGICSDPAPNDTNSAAAAAAEGDAGADTNVASHLQATSFTAKLNAKNKYLTQSLLKQRIFVYVDDAASRYTVLREFRSICEDLDRQFYHSDLGLTPTIDGHPVGELDPLTAQGDGLEMHSTALDWFEPPFDFFLSHFQTNAGPQVMLMKQQLLKANPNLRIWLDKDTDDPR